MGKIEAQQIPLVRLALKRAEKNRRQRIVEPDLGGAAGARGKHVIPVAPERGQLEAVIRQAHFRAACFREEAVSTFWLRGRRVRVGRHEVVLLIDGALQRGDAIGRIGKSRLEKRNVLPVKIEDNLQQTDGSHQPDVPAERGTQIVALKPVGHRKFGDLRAIRQYADRLMLHVGVGEFADQKGMESIRIRIRDNEFAFGADLSAVNNGIARRDQERLVFEE